MLALLLVAAAATIIGVRGLVDDVTGTARQLHHESVVLTALRTDLVDHEALAHKLLSDAPVDRAAYRRQQHEISRRFANVTSVLPAGNGMRATVVEAQKYWRTGLMLHGLWSSQLRDLHGDHSVDNPSLSAASNSTRTVLDGVANRSLRGMDRRLAHAAVLERVLFSVLLSLFGLAIAVTVYFRRRMAKDLVRPVAAMHSGVLKLQAGDYDHRIDVVRRDELGDLAEAFNGMAGALLDSHRALTLRATHDSLTGLPNRASLTERLAASFSPNEDRQGGKVSVLFIDIDDFKDVNDSLGHEGGDALLIQLAARLNECVGPFDLVTRLGGDEFAIVVVEDDDDGSTAVAVAERIIEATRAPFSANGARLMVSVSIGVAQRRPEISNAAELLRRADFAMYMAKGGGKARYQLFDAAMHDSMVARSTLKAELAVAVSSDQLRLEYQPIADLRTGEVLGVEALVRWEHPTLGLLAPADFISLAEETGDIGAIGCWVLGTASRQVAHWRNTMDQCAGLWVSVNLSSFQLPNPHSLASIQHILADPEVQAECIVLEVTESALAADDGGIESLNLLKGSGVRIAIDDFGPGFSSLSTLSRLPVDILKIDRSFVSGQVSVSPSAPMLEGILMLADKLSLEVIAEGIEAPEQLDLLRALGCKMGQGFLLGRPTPAQALESLLAVGGLLQLTVPVTTGGASR